MFSKRKKEGPSSFGLFAGFPPSFEKREKRKKKTEKDRKRQKKTEKDRRDGKERRRKKEILIKKK